MHTLVHGSIQNEEHEQLAYPSHAVPVRDDELIHGGYSDSDSRPSFGREPIGFDVEALSQAPAGRLLGGKYRPERVLGESRIAVNIRVCHVELGHRFLFIHLHRRVRGHVDAVERFLKGARAALRLQSEHTARTIDAGRLETGVPFVVSEYPLGSSLRHVLHIAGPLPVSEAVEYVLQTCEALAEAHARGIFHGHLTPPYLFLTRSPDGGPLIKVLGFGVADALCVTPLDELVVGASRDDEEELSPRNVDCLAPEQIRDETDVDALTDIWGLGALLHELLAASPVFVASNSRALAAMIAADMPTPLTSIRSDVPAGLEAVILRCLAKDRQHRFASVSELAVALEPFAPLHLAMNVNRIVRTLARSSVPPSSPPPLPVNPQAMVHVGRAVHVEPAVHAEPAPSFRRVRALPSGLNSLQELSDDKGITIPPKVLKALGAATALLAAALLGGVLVRGMARAEVPPATTVAKAAPAPVPPPAAPAPEAAPAPVESAAVAPSAVASSLPAPLAAAAAMLPAPVAPAAVNAIRPPSPAPVRPVAARAPQPAFRPAAVKPKAASTLFDDTE